VDGRRLARKINDERSAVGFTAAYAFSANPDPFIFNNLGLAFSLTR